MYLKAEPIFILSVCGGGGAGRGGGRKFCRQNICCLLFGALLQITECQKVFLNNFEEDLPVPCVMCNIFAIVLHQIRGYFKGKNASFGMSQTNQRTPIRRIIHFGTLTNTFYVFNFLRKDCLHQVYL